MNFTGDLFRGRVAQNQMCFKIVFKTTDRAHDFISMTVV